jgi:hypothetical protein
LNGAALNPLPRSGLIEYNVELIWRTIAGQVFGLQHNRIEGTKYGDEIQ